MKNHIHRPNQASFTATAPKSSRKGFTLIELLVVVTIIGILVSVILVASYDGIRTANLKATQALVLKLDLAVKERMQGLLDDEVYPNATHIWLATPASNKVGGVSTFGPMRGLSPGRGGNARAKAIAMTDYLRAEMPDVFVVNSDDREVTLPQGKFKIFQLYPLNFAGFDQSRLGMPLSDKNVTLMDPLLAPFILPIGTAIRFDGSSVGSYYPPVPNIPSDPVNDLYNKSYLFGGTGIFGASYTAAAGLYKQLGYAPSGYDGVDNNGNQLIDETLECVNSSDLPGFLQELSLKLSNHQHKTARSEMLYALLIEGQGPLGAAFSRDDFTDREIQDTDEDGLMEFVDAWGEPLQFYRWPIWYTSDNQRGWAEYPQDPWVTRERGTVDPSNSLISLDWWYDNTGLGNDPVVGPDGVPRNGSLEMQAFEYFFHTLTESSSFLSDSSNWDRIGKFKRRAYRFTPLILSGGPDTKVGVRSWGQLQESMPILNFLRDYENLAVKFDYYAFSFVDFRRPGFTMVGTQTGLTLDDEILASAEDDISSHALQQGLGGGAR